jgi:ABC-type hemin transport system substrate-binding protein
MTPWSRLDATYRLRLIMRQVRLGAAIALLVLLASAAGRSQPQDIPARIVSTSPSITETLFALGLGDRVVGVSTYCRYPAAVASLPKVGTFLKPDAETIARLKPDLVVVHKGPNNVLAQLGTLGVRTAVVNPGALPSVFETIREISAAAGVPDRGVRLVGDLTAGLDRVKASVAGRTPRKILIIVGRRTGTLTDIIAVGPGSYLHDIATIAGGSNVLAATALQYPRISMETVISLAPDVIVDVGEMGESPADSDRRRQITEGLWRSQTLVKAVRERNVHAVHDEAFVVPGPRIIVVARALARWLHGVDPQ